MICCSCAA